MSISPTPIFSENIAADGFQNAAEASDDAFAVAPAKAEPMFDAPCSKTWNPAPWDTQQATINAPAYTFRFFIIL